MSQQEVLTLRQKLHLKLREGMSADLMNKCADLQTSTYTHEILIMISFKGSINISPYEIKKIEELLNAKFNLLSTRKRLLTLYFTSRRVL